MGGEALVIAAGDAKTIRVNTVDRSFMERVK
jgi:hypothetical protein